MEYNNGNRGLFQCEKRAKQQVSFEGMIFPGRYGKLTVTPTDVDGFVQLDLKDAFIFFEVKHRDREMPNGQLDAMKKAVDAIKDGKHNSILVVAYHCVDDVEEKILAKDTIVRKYYTSKKWFISDVDFKGEINTYDCLKKWLNQLNTKKKFCNNAECEHVLNCTINEYMGIENNSYFYMPKFDILNNPFGCKRDYIKICEYIKNKDFISESGKKAKDSLDLINYLNHDLTVQQ